MSTIATKPKVASKTDNFDDSHEYKCLRCGKSEQNPVGKFYKSQWSELYQKNDKYVPVCQSCVNEMFDTLSRRYKSDETACILLCHMLDIPFYYSLFDSIRTNNSVFSIGLYLRQINGKQYQYKTFCQTILDGELNKSKVDQVAEKEAKWDTNDIQNKKDVLEVVGYDPFEGYADIDRKFLFNEIIKYFDEDISSDAHKLSAIIQIVNNNNQIRRYDLLISTLDPVKDSQAIKDLIANKTSLGSMNDKTAKENEISVKNRSNKDAGKSTLGKLQIKLRKLGFEDAEENFYKQLDCPGTRWVVDMSHRSITENGMFDENDKQEIFNMSREGWIRAQADLDKEKEKNRLLQIEFDKLKLQLKGDAE